MIYNLDYTTKNAGWIRLRRDLLESHLFQNEKLWKVFTWSLLKATWKPREVTIGRQKVTLEPGQFIFGRYAAAQELGIAPSSTWDYINLLKKQRILDVKSNNKFSIVTVENWEMWQGDAEFSDNKPDTKSDNTSTTLRHKQERKEGKEVKKYSPEFETWFSSWPRPQAKSDSFKNFEKVRKEKGLEFIWQTAKNYLDYMGSIPEKERGPYYSSNNFFGQRAYCLDFTEPKKYTESPKKRQHEAPM